MTRIIFISLYFLLIISSNLFSQDRNYARQIINKLSSKDFHGRGYVQNGDILTAQYLAEEFKDLGIKPMGKSYLQPFEISINTFPDTLQVAINNKKIIAGRDFYIGGGSTKTYGKFKVVRIDTNQLKNTERIASTFQNKVALLPAIAERDNRTYNINAAGYIFTHTENMIWKLSDATTEKPYFYIHCADSLTDNINEIEVAINNKYFPHYKTANVIGMIEGTEYPDSFYVFSAHFDHLGKMGKDVIFPGSNDNASGIAMLLNLAQYYNSEANKPKYSIILMAFAAEECGLFGSNYAADNLPFEQEKIKFLINLDMVGTGSEGIGMVNALVEPKADKLIRNINEQESYFDDIRSGGARCVSDHCAFAKKGIPSIFIFTRGKEYTHYHTPLDKGPVPLTKWHELFNLLITFVEKY